MKLQTPKKIYTMGTLKFPLEAELVIEGYRFITASIRGTVRACNPNLSIIGCPDLQTLASTLQTGLELKLTWETPGGYLNHHQIKYKLSHSGPIDYSLNFLKVRVLDCWLNPTEPLSSRLKDINRFMFDPSPIWLINQHSVKVGSLEALQSFHIKTSSQYSGTILRNPDSPYIFGTCTKGDNSVFHLPPYGKGKAIVVDSYQDSEGYTVILDSHKLPKGFKAKTDQDLSDRISKMVEFYYLSSPNTRMPLEPLLKLD